MHVNTPLKSQMWSSRRLPCQGESFPVLHCPLPLRSSTAAAKPTSLLQVAPGPAHPSHPCIPSCCSVSSEKNRSCSQLPESGPSEADRSRRGRRNTFVSRAREPGPPNLLPLTPRGGFIWLTPLSIAPGRAAAVWQAQLFWHHRAAGSC